MLEPNESQQIPQSGAVDLLAFANLSDAYKQFVEQPLDPNFEQPEPYSKNPALVPVDKRETSLLYCVFNTSSLETVDPNLFSQFQTFNDLAIQPFTEDVLRSAFTLKVGKVVLPKIQVIETPKSERDHRRDKKDKRSKKDKKKEKKKRKHSHSEEGEKKSKKKKKRHKHGQDEGAPVPPIGTVPPPVGGIPASNAPPVSSEEKKRKKKEKKEKKEKKKSKDKEKDKN
eukprot:TRINITY_DN3274_c0_g1_i1.p1 TRINITY_DN3274_c0_g1~~TRINITY_DN3274_c0_g1_i1.p1  ORF type:complete len:227 (+),score=73.33 TRINITY_DN3274_c0_g1_i1:130-810(+)